MHISITGDLGSGKSTVAKALAAELGYTYFSTGQLQRQLAAEMGMDTLQFNKYTDNNLSVDDYIDQRLKDLNQQAEPHILDSRLAWHFVHSSFKVYLMAHEEVAAARVFADDQRTGEHQARTVQARMKEQAERRTIEDRRFESNYGIKPHLFTNFDAVVDSSTATVQQVTGLILDLFRQHLPGSSFHRIWLSPLRLLPSLPLTLAATNDAEACLQCLLSNKLFYTYSGHAHLLLALQQNKPFIPVAIKAKNDEPVLNGLTATHYVQEQYNPEYLTEWETKFGIHFFRGVQLV